VQLKPNFRDKRENDVLDMPIIMRN